MSKISLKKSLLTFVQLRKGVYNEIVNHKQLEGIRWKRFPGINKYLKGFRPGELTVLTGPTGCGKTTFLSEYSLDLCLQGVPTLWGNFEIQNTRLCKAMMNQLAQKQLSANLQEFDHWADKFTELPMYFMNYHGAEAFENVLATMKEAVTNHQVKHVIIDNLQFMMGTRNKKYFHLDRYEYQDHVIGSCRSFATEKECHITLVIHPRKEDSGELTLNSIFGGAKASQEADNILIFQVEWKGNTRQRKYLQISKNRYDGDLGSITLKFNKETQGFGTSSSKSNQVTDDILID
ncbi:twinkle protein, mitochondrial [Tetranychus urticae]|uniref:twinkle protein, mitochondrial n=1 Tax=Tetranychus urticae TaxID=32264 RepID=UPI00077BC7A0|nr:twinkle protein, mitochondrial [Tetranychus urticae]